MDETVMRMLGVLAKRNGGELRFTAEELREGLCGMVIDCVKDPVSEDLVVRLSNEERLEQDRSKA